MFRIPGRESSSRRRSRVSKNRSRRAAFFQSLEDRRLLAALRVATYNVLQGSPNTSAEQGYYSTILEAIGNEDKAGVQQPIDLLVLQETSSNSVNSIENILDSLYADDYATYVTPSYSGLAYGFVYNTATLDLLGTQNVSGSFTRPPLRGHFEPVGSTTADADFYVYSAHLKAGSGDASTRASEAAALRADADALGEGENVLIMGDFNMYSSFEGAYSNLTASGAGQVFDPISRPGNWHNNNAFKDIHTQDPSGGGGMDDRFDLQFASGELFVSGGLDYIPGSYRAFGNNGTHSLNGTLTGTGAASNVLTALRGASDHLPVVVDYEFDSVPAGITVNETDGSTIVAENSYHDSYSVVLDTIPSSDVMVTINPDSGIDLGAGPGVSTQLTFTPANALTPQTVTVMAFDDQTSQGNRNSTIVQSYSSLDSSYDTLSNTNVSVVIVDDENPTIFINEVDAVTSGNTEFIELYDGGIGNASLTGKTLVLYNGSSDTSYAAFDLDGYTTDDNGLFVIGNSGVAGVDLVFANSLLQDGADAVALYDGDASSFPNGSSVTTANLVDALVYDTDDSDDAGLLNLLLAGQPQVNENENGGQFSQSLSRLPDGGMVRTTSSVAVTTPTPGALNVPRQPGVVVLKSENLTVTEGGSTDNYSIQLTSVPTADVNLTIDPDDDIDLGAGQGAPIVLAFTPSNAMSPQTVTVTAFDDTLAEGLHSGLIQHSFASSDATYAAQTISDLDVTVFDDEPLPPPDILISEVMYNPASSGEGGNFSPEWVEIVNVGTATQDISGWKLSDEDGVWGAIPGSTNLQPNQVAVLFDGLSTPITSEAGFRNTWGIPANALVVGVNWSEELANDPSPTNELLTLEDATGLARDSVNYDDAAPWPSGGPEGPSIYLTNLLADNDDGSNWSYSAVGVDGAVAANGFPFSSSDVGSPGSVPASTSGALIITETSSSTDVTEGGSSDEVTIVLDAVPSDDVIVTITPDGELDLGAGPGVAITHSFTPTTALASFSFDVDALNDQIAEGAHSGLVSFSTLSADPSYNNLTVSDVIVSITDNDTAGVSIVETDGSTDVVEGGLDDVFTVVLDTIPIDVVTVTATPDSQLDLGSGPGVAIELTFDAGNALVGQDVSVIANNDFVIEGSHTGQIAFAITSSDSRYASTSVPNLTVSISDNSSSISLSGSVEDYSGPGLYTLDFYVGATGEDQTILGWNLPMSFNAPGVSFGGTDGDLIVNPAFDLKAVAPLSQPSNWGLGGTSLGAGITVPEGTSMFLFSVDVTVDSTAMISSPTEVARIVTSGPDAINLAFFDENVDFIQNIEVGSGATLTTDSPPKITDVIIAGSGWAPEFIDALDGGGVGAGNGLGLSLPGLDQTNELPWTNIDTIVVDFSKDVQKASGADVDIFDIALAGVNVPDYKLSGGGISTSYSDGGGSGPFRLTISYASPVSGDGFNTDRFTLTISDAIEDSYGNRLDGEWADDTTLVSGDSLEGGSGVISFNILEGDVSRDGLVFGNDTATVNSLQFRSPASLDYNVFADLDGSALIFGNDTANANSRQFASLPSGTPSQAALVIENASEASGEQMNALHKDLATQGDEFKKETWESDVDLVFSELLF
ncbi:lamin tail domain-containing protein [Rhodopirellula sp. SWK7]|uniref:lamin tail domain-containing protein n=1 Tax=Rhodopirellula sp. SWK7 TaxID=595460 RepID=UPI0002C02ED5|nr:lamin tail domain-containing protein [Rhodopirellula sp. SWK7]EMI42522.1 Endonuclease/exonuclease/phosphatase domain protein [Rhodopirellula sp. SWK7]